MNGLPKDARATVGQCLLLKAKRTGLGHRASVANDPSRTSSLETGADLCAISSSLSGRKSARLYPLHQAWS
jgi:hypothetical protein